MGSDFEDNVIPGTDERRVPVSKLRQIKDEVERIEDRSSDIGTRSRAESLKIKIADIIDRYD